MQTMQTEQDTILLKRVPEVSTRIYCQHCSRDRAAEDKRIKVVVIRGIPHKQIRCRFCTDVA